MYILTSCAILTYKSESMPQSDAHPTGDQVAGLHPRRVWQHSFVKIDHEIFSTVILSLSLIQEGQRQFLAKECTQVLVNRFED